MLTWSSSIRSSRMSDRQRLTPPQDHDVAVAAEPELVDLFYRVTSGDGGVGPVGPLQGPGEDDLAPGVQDVGERMVGGRCHGPGDALVGGAAHDVRVRAPEKVELRRVVGLTVFGAGRSRTSKTRCPRRREG